MEARSHARPSSPDSPERPGRSRRNETRRRARPREEAAPRATPAGQNRPPSALHPLPVRAQILYAAKFARTRSDPLRYSIPPAGRERVGQPIVFPIFRLGGLHPARQMCHDPLSGAGWSRLAARRAHNPKVGGSNPPPATNIEGRHSRREVPVFFFLFPVPIHSRMVRRSPCSVTCKSPRPAPGVGTTCSIRSADGYSPDPRPSGSRPPSAAA